MESKVLKAVKILNDANGVSPSVIATYLKGSAGRDSPVTETDVKNILRSAVKSGLLSVTATGKYKFVQNHNASVIELDAGRRRRRSRSKSRRKSRRGRRRSLNVQDCGCGSRRSGRGRSRSRSRRGKSRRRSSRRRSRSRTTH